MQLQFPATMQWNTQSTPLAWHPMADRQSLHLAGGHSGARYFPPELVETKNRAKRRRNISLSSRISLSSNIVLNANVVPCLLDVEINNCLLLYNVIICQFECLQHCQEILFKWSESKSAFSLNISWLNQIKWQQKCFIKPRTDKLC